MNARLLLAPLGLLTAAAFPAAAQLVPGTDPEPLGPKGGTTSSCVVNPLDDSEVLVTRVNTGSASYQLHRSTDGGLSFTPLNPPVFSGDVHELTVDQRDNQTLYARGRYTLYRSTDFGATWVDLNIGAFSVSPVSGYVGSVIGFAVPSSGTNLYVFSAEELKRSTDDGATWTLHPVTGTFLSSDLAVAPTAPDTLYLGAANGLWKSTDAGSTWSQPDPTFTHWIKAVVVSPFDANVVHGGTSLTPAPADRGVWRSLDGGVTMTKTGNIPELGNGGFLQYGPGGQYLWYGMLPDLAWSVDLGDTWTMADGGLPDGGAVPAKLAFDAAGNRLMPASSNDFQSVGGGGLYWMPSGAPTTWFHIGFSSTPIADVAVSTPGGPRYAAAGPIHRALPGDDFTEAPGIQANVTSILVDQTDPSKMLAAAYGAIPKLTMWTVTDWGDTAVKVYEQYSTGPVEDIALDPSNPLNAVAVKNTAGWGTEGILYSPLGGNGWNELAPTVGWAAREVAYDPHTTGRALVLLDGPAMSESLDGGATWSAPAALWIGGGEASGLEFDPFDAGVIYAGDEVGGLHRSDDDGATWASLGIGVHGGSEIEMHPQMPGLLWVSDGTGSVQVSGDGGATWAVASTVPGGKNATALALDTLDGSLVFGSTGASAWSQPVASPFINLGPGTAGTGGFVPRLWAEGSLPQMTSGSPGFKIGGDRVVGFDGGNPNLPGVVVPVLGFGSFPVPFLGGTWYPSILLPYVQLPAVLAVGTPGVGGTGSWSMPIPLPADPTLAGGLLVFQCVVLDDGALLDSQYAVTDSISVLLIP
jgi:photosystem II stability/assembly factor-like uncharacterized protein